MQLCSQNHNNTYKNGGSKWKLKTKLLAKIKLPTIIIKLLTLIKLSTTLLNANKTMIANFELYPKNKNIRNAPTIRTKDLTNNFVYSYISLTKQQIISFYEKKENKTFKYWIIFIISFLLTLPLALLEFAGLLDIIFFL